MDPDLLDLLSRVDTPTVLNAIEVVQGKRGFQGFTRGTMVCTEPGRAMVGFAATAQIAGLAPPQEPVDVIRARRMAYYKAMHDAPKPSVAVVEDADYPNAVASYWGEVNVTVHKAFGMAGALTNGVVRDLGDLPVWLVGPKDDQDGDIATLPETQTGGDATARLPEHFLDLHQSAATPRWKRRPT